jgi:hypothetical protein
VASWGGASTDAGAAMRAFLSSYEAAIYSPLAILRGGVVVVGVWAVNSGAVASLIYSP